MKKIPVILCLILMLTTVGVSCGLAEPRCPNHPEAEPYWTDVEFWESLSPIRHKFTVDYLCCPVCDRVLDEFSETSYHTLVNGVCTECGYVRPGTDELEAHAWTHIQDIAYRNCYIQYDSPLYETAGGESKPFGVTKMEEYRIIGSAEVNKALWLEIANVLSTDGIGWIPANIAYVQDGEVITEVKDYMIGHVCRVIVGSGKVRIEPGDSPVIEYVHEGETYKILDAANGSDGKVWYKIKKDGNEGWISAGIVSFQ